MISKKAARDSSNYSERDSVDPFLIKSDSLK